MGNDVLTERVIGAAIQLHRALGPGLLESAYEACLTQDLRDLGLEVETQKPLPVHYRGLELELAYRLDLVVEQRLVLELKAVEELTALHEAQLLTYLRLSNYRVGLLLNFNSRSMRSGIRRLVHNWPE